MGSARTRKIKIMRKIQKRFEVRSRVPEFHINPFIQISTVASCIRVVPGVQAKPPEEIDDAYEGEAEQAANTGGGKQRGCF